MDVWAQEEAEFQAQKAKAAEAEAQKRAEEYTTSVTHTLVQRTVLRTPPLCTRPVQRTP